VTRQSVPTIFISFGKSDFGKLFYKYMQKEFNLHLLHLNVHEF